MSPLTLTLTFKFMFMFTFTFTVNSSLLACRFVNLSVCSGRGNLHFSYLHYDCDVEMKQTQIPPACKPDNDNETC